MFVTNTANGDQPSYWISGGVAALEKIGFQGSLTPQGGGGYISGGQMNLGAGLPAGPVPINGATGISNTWMLYDFGAGLK